MIYDIFLSIVQGGPLQETLYQFGAEQNDIIYYALSFVAVVQAGSFTSASKQTRVSKAQLSRHVKTLESLLNIQLLHRTSRSIVITAQGQAFFNEFLKIKHSCDLLIARTQQDSQEMHGTLKISAPIDFGIQFLPPIIETFSN